MSESVPNPLGYEDGLCGAFEEDLNLYLDGELAFDRQPAFFAHLSRSNACREYFNAMLLFRQMSRQERLHVPPAVDDEFLQRLEKRHRLKVRIDRAADRRPLWEQRRMFSVSTAVTALLFCFVLGAFWQGEVQTRSTLGSITQKVERVDFRFVRQASVPHFYIYPGLVVTEDDPPALQEAMELEL